MLRTLVPPPITSWSDFQSDWVWLKQNVRGVNWSQYTPSVGIPGAARRTANSRLTITSETHDLELYVGDTLTKPPLIQPPQDWSDTQKEGEALIHGYPWWIFWDRKTVPAGKRCIYADNRLYIDELIAHHMVPGTMGVFITAISGSDTAMRDTQFNVVRISPEFGTQKVHIKALGAALANSAAWPYL